VPAAIWADSSAWMLASEMVVPLRDVAGVMVIRWEKLPRPIA
jgi:hypothetical protein